MHLIKKKRLLTLLHTANTRYQLPTYFIHEKFYQFQFCLLSDFNPYCQKLTIKLHIIRLETGQTTPIWHTILVGVANTAVHQ